MKITKVDCHVLLIPNFDPLACSSAGPTMLSKARSSSLSRLHRRRRKDCLGERMPSRFRRPARKETGAAGGSGGFENLAMVRAPLPDPRQDIREERPANGCVC